MGGPSEHVGEAGDEATLLDGQRLDLAGDAADRLGLVARLAAGRGSGCGLLVAAEEASQDHVGYLGCVRVR